MNTSPHRDHKHRPVNDGPPQDAHQPGAPSDHSFSTRASPRKKSSQAFSSNTRHRHRSPMTRRTCGKQEAEGHDPVLGSTTPYFCPWELSGARRGGVLDRHINVTAPGVTSPGSRRASSPAFSPNRTFAPSGIAKQLRQASNRENKHQSTDRDRNDSVVSVVENNENVKVEEDYLSQITPDTNASPVDVKDEPVATPASLDDLSFKCIGIKLAEPCYAKERIVGTLHIDIPILAGTYLAFPNGNKVQMERGREGENAPIKQEDDIDSDDDAAAEIVEIISSDYDLPSLLATVESGYTKEQQGPDDEVDVDALEEVIGGVHVGRVRTCDGEKLYLGC